MRARDWEIGYTVSADLSTGPWPRARSNYFSRAASRELPT